MLCITNDVENKVVTTELAQIRYKKNCKMVRSLGRSIAIMRITIYGLQTIGFLMCVYNMVFSVEVNNLQLKYDNNTIRLFGNSLDYNQTLYNSSSMERNFLMRAGASEEMLSKIKSAIEAMIFVLLSLLHNCLSRKLALRDTKEEEILIDSGLIAISKHGKNTALFRDEMSKANSLGKFIIIVSVLKVKGYHGAK